MDAASLLALPATPASGLQIFALFVNFFFPALALLVVAVRVAGRVAVGQFALDDWLVCIAMLMSVAETVISFFFIKTNFVGIPPDQIPPHDPTQGLIWSYAVQILYNPILALVKSSVLIFLSRLFGQKDWIRRFLLWLNVANISQMVAVFFAITLQCLPIAFNWDPTIRGGRCVDRRVLFISTAVFNIVTDLLILGLPLWVFSSLKIPKRTKIALLFVFLLGFLVTITSVVRLVLLVQGLFQLAVFSDMANNVGFVTSAIETNLALITASAPALRPIFRSRERGGWFFARSSVARSRVAPTYAEADLEAGQQQKSVGWDNSSSYVTVVGSGVGGKFGRGGSRGGRKGGSRGLGTRKGGGVGGKTAANKKSRPVIRIKTDVAGVGLGMARGAAELRSQSPRSGEEEAMTNNGIMRVSDIQREIDGIVKEIAVSASGETSRPRTPKTPSKTTPPSRPRPSMETITVGATMAVGGAPTPLPPPRPSTSGSGSGPPRRYPPERYYSESVYPDPDFEGRDERNYNEDRMSRYGDRRFGVVTPRGTTPTSKGWEGSGRPF